MIESDDNGGPDALATERDHAALWLQRTPSPRYPVLVRPGETVADHARWRASLVHRLRSTEPHVYRRALDDARAYRRAVESASPPAQ